MARYRWLGVMPEANTSFLSVSLTPMSPGWIIQGYENTAKSADPASLGKPTDSLSDFST